MNFGVGYEMLCVILILVFVMIGLYVEVEV